MKREILITKDGSTTIHLPVWNEQYHSKHGAIQEAYHVFIKNGLRLFSKEVSILEIGFGTGLNALITLLESSKDNIKVNYSGIEAYPVSLEEVQQLNYTNELNVKELQNTFLRMHESPWEEYDELTPNFSLTKHQLFFQDLARTNEFDLVYFDAFGARVQPELWTEAVFAKMFLALKNKGVLVTYSAKGSVRRTLQAVGFTVERLEGPPGKREMLRATKS